MAKTKRGRRKAVKINIGNRINEELERLGKTGPWLAKQIGVDPSTVRSWHLTGAYPRNLETVAEVLGVTVQHLWRAE